MRSSILVAAVVLVPYAFTQTIRVNATPSHAVNSFVPAKAIGSGVDRIPLEATDKLFTDAAVQQIRSAGWQTVTYRQNTELFIEAWHWNPQGSWSANDKGYFTGNGTPTEFIRHSFGYPLTHRGFTRNDGTEAGGYSRMTDGDLNSYWKSNPYLTKTFTGEDDTLHPQWVILDLASSVDIDAIRIAWGEPYARRYVVQYWSGDDPIKQPTKGVWQAFPGGAADQGRGGTSLLHLSSAPIPVRFVRILMTESSNTCDSHGAGDRRNCVGYAVREIFIGKTSADGAFHDS